jgi:aquaporin Z
MRMKSQPLQIFRWFAAEFIGTLFLASVVGVAVFGSKTFASGYSSLFAPLAIGAVVMVMVYLLGPVSGAHFNPAVSLAMFVFRKIRSLQLLTYLAAQLVGAWFGAKLALSLTTVAPAIIVVNARPVALGEFFGTFLLVFAITFVVLGKVKQEIGGIVIGAALMVGITLAAITGGGVLNPAIALTFGSYGLALLLVPFLGGLTGAAAAVLLADSSKE